MRVSAYTAKMQVFKKLLLEGCGKQIYQTFPGCFCSPVPTISDELTTNASREETLQKNYKTENEVIDFRPLCDGTSVIVCKMVLVASWLTAMVSNLVH